MSSIPGADRYEMVEHVDEDAIADDLTLHSVPADFDVDPVTFEVLRHRLWQINDEQGITLKNVSGSPVVTEANDFNVTISDERGNVTNFGPYVTEHAGAMDVIIKWVLKHRSADPGIRPGDMYLCNDPWVGAIHQNDMAVVAPVFLEGELFAWVSSTLHHSDVGGLSPGSFSPDARDVYAEGQPTPPVKIVEGGDLRPDIEDMILRRSRIGPVVSMDLRAQIASNNVAKDRLRAQIEKYGGDTVKGVMKQSMEYAENRLRSRLSELPDGVWSHTDYIEVAHTGDRGVYEGSMRIEKEGDRLNYEVSGDAQAGMINCTYSGLRGGIMSSTLPLLCYDIPWAIGGIYRVFSIEAQPGIVTNATFPGGTSMASLSGKWLVQNLGIQCISKMLGSSEAYEDRLMATTSGAFPVDATRGVDQRGESYVTLAQDQMASGFGARSFDDGIDTGGCFSLPAGQTANKEHMELRYPMLYLDRREEVDSGGAGEFRGGVGGSCLWIPHGTDDPITHVCSAFGVAFPTSRGLDGGYPGAAIRYEMIRGSDVREQIRAGRIPADRSELDGETDVLPPKCETLQERDDVFFLRWTGGGGFGDPIDRDPARVVADVRDGYVSVDEAERVYGVVLEDGELDEEATERNRANIRERRLDNDPWEASE